MYPHLHGNQRCASVEKSIRSVAYKLQILDPSDTCFDIEILLKAIEEQINEIQKQRQDTETNEAGQVGTLHCKVLDLLTWVENADIEGQGPLEKSKRLPSAKSRYSLNLSEEERKIRKLLERQKENHQQLKAQNEILIGKLDTANRELQILRDEKIELERDLDLQRQNNRESANSKWDPKCSFKGEMAENVQKHNRQLQKELQEAIAQKDYWMNRLSKIAGDRLLENNPNISDLSDPNRPTKLGERYGELYDNEWTATIEVLANEDPAKDKIVIPVLFDILMRSYKYAEDLADKQLENVRKTLFALDGIYDEHKENNKTVPNEESRIPKEILRATDDAQKICSVVSRRNVQKMFLATIRTEQKFQDLIEKCPAFIEECIDLNWAMVMQKPRPVFFSPKLDDAKKILVDKELFTPYTRNGDIVEYVVWPALLLHDNGPLLKKGIIQPVDQAN